MTTDEIRSLCETLRAEGVHRARFDAAGALCFVEFFPAAAGIPTAEERHGAETKAGPADDTSGFTRALDILRTGGVSPKDGT